MTTSTHAFAVRDDFPLFTSKEPITASARRDDAYTVSVVRSREQAHHRLLELLDGADVVAVITDERVDALYGGELRRALRGAGRDVIVRAVPPGERSKSLEQAVALLHWLATSRLGRRDVVVNLGGGVVNDLGGWVASTYMRGVPYINVPTTLLAMVDGALGGKLGVNHAVAKNLLGGFAQPLGVIADVGLLRSLERRHVAAGLAECIKKAVIASPAYFDFIEDQAGALLAAEPDRTELLVRTAAAIKTALVARDPYEEDLRRPLNFGHTVGHPIETITGYGPLLHGEAVALGMVVEATIAHARGWLRTDVVERLVAVLAACGLPVRAADLPVRIERTQLLAALEKVRLIRAGSLRWVLPLALGETAIVDDVSATELAQALRDRGVV
jgi:3-dehydroquinate synthase